MALSEQTLFFFAEFALIKVQNFVSCVVQDISRPIFVPPCRIKEMDGRKRIKQQQLMNSRSINRLGNRQIGC